MSKLLFDQNPLIIDPKLAVIIGVNEAIFLQQIHYWLEINKKTKRNFEEGRYWTYNTIENWKVENFPFWSVSTIKRTVANLKKIGVIITSNFNKSNIDKTLWYTIDYDVLNALSEEEEKQEKPEKPHTYALGQNEPMHTYPLGQSEPSIGSIWTNPLVQSEPSNTRDYTETIKEEEEELIKKKKKVPPHVENFQAKEEVIELCESIFNRALNLGEKTEIRRWSLKYPRKMILEVIKYCSLRNVKTVVYISQTLENWKKKNVSTRQENEECYKTKRERHINTQGRF